MATSNVKKITAHTRKLPRGAIALDEFLEHKFSVDKELLGKTVLAKSIGMVAGPRGGGKTWLALLLSYSIAGSKHLKPWGKGAGVQVAYLDGEMRASGLQERLQLIHARNTKGESIAQAKDNLQIISRDCMGETIGSIDTKEGQDAIDLLIPSGTELIVIDNLSAWTSGGREDSTSWAAVKNWLIAKRLEGIAVLLVHHTGKNGAQRGTSAHENLLDYSILLSPLPSNPERGNTRFMVEHTKLRDYIPELRQRHEYAIWTDNNKLEYECNPVGLALPKNVAEMDQMHKDGSSFEKIGKHFKVSKSTVSRALTKLRGQKTGGDGNADVDDPKST